MVGAGQATWEGFGLRRAGVVREILVTPGGIAGSQAHIAYNVFLTVLIACLVLAVVVAVPWVARRMKPLHRQDIGQQPNPVEVP